MSNRLMSKTPLTRTLTTLMRTALTTRFTNPLTGKARLGAFPTPQQGHSLSLRGASWMGLTALLMLAYPAMGENIKTLKAVTTVTDIADNKDVWAATPSDTTTPTVLTAPNETASSTWLWEAKPVRVVNLEKNVPKDTVREQATSVAPTLSPDQGSSNAPGAWKPSTDRASGGREKTAFPLPVTQPITQPNTPASMPSVTLTLWCDTHYPEGVMESLAREALRLSRIPHLRLTMVFAGLPGRLVNHQPDEVRQRANATLKPLQAAGIGITIDPPTLRHWRRVWAKGNGITEQSDRTPPTSTSASDVGDQPDREDAQDATACDATTSLDVGPLPRLPLLVVEVSGIESTTSSQPATATTTTTANVVLVEGATSLEVALGRLLTQIPQTASELAFFSGLEAVLGERVEGPSLRTERGSGFSTASPASPLSLFSSLTFQSPRDWAHGESEALAITRQLGVPAGVLATLTESYANRGEQGEHEDGVNPSGVALRATLRALHRGDSLARETGTERLVRLRQRGALALESEWVGGNSDE